MILKKFSILILILITFKSVLSSQNIYIDFTNNTNTSYSLSDVKKITYTGDVMNLHFNDGSLFNCNVSTINHFEFDQIPLSINSQSKNSNLLEFNIYPNPVYDSLHFSFSLIEDDYIGFDILDMQGKTIIASQPIIYKIGKNQDTIDISILKPGIYVCCLKREERYFSKRIIKK